MPEDLPDRMPDRMSEDMPEDMPDRMPEDMPDRMPEDLPVTKCINVMVGITRSKVIGDKMIHEKKKHNAIMHCDVPIQCPHLVYGYYGVIL